ncbi:glycoside hydrolase family 36 protein [Mucilaginibacter sp. UYCu711]|uniref:glycoside hydrolase family 36 protein n=1 Tax=Mucilaginibacter sp. UYCu711 TaxID=3156339 RepID=UPI003D1CC3F3
MNRFKAALFILLAITVSKGICQPKETNTLIVLKNKFLERKFTVTDGRFYTSSYKNLPTGNDYSRDGSEEFYFTVNKQGVSRPADNTAFDYVRNTLTTIGVVQQLTVFLKGKAGGVAENIDLKLVYDLYDDFPVVRKQLIVTNHTNQSIAIADLEVERLNLVPLNSQYTDIYSNYGTHLTWRPYKGNHQDAAIYVYNTFKKEGFILGNESPSILKRTEVYAHDDRISIGLTKLTDNYPFKKWIAPNENFKSPKTFICLVKAEKWQDAFEGYFADFIRTGLGVKLFEKETIPFLFYNTWFPFRTNISDTLIRKVADGLSGTGTDILIMDDGWQADRGDWETDKKKFPSGLKPVCDYIIKKGMRPGLWMGLATVDENSKVYREHPEWAIRDKNGKPTYLHTNGSRGLYTMSMGSGYYDYILNRIKTLVKENNLAYIKLDFAIANSAYVLDYEKKGDYGSEAKLYPDRESSFYSIYERTLKLFDELHTAFPGLLIDCTYEVWGEYYLNDFALIEHADYDWLTNYEANPPEGPINIRQMSYDRARVIPAATNLIGNQQMYSGTDEAIRKHYKYTYLSLASTKALLVGDPRTLTDASKKWYQKWNDWFKMMDAKYQFTRFTQTSDVFERATMTNWDGCYKFNKDKQGGVLFFYRNGSLEKQRIFAAPFASPDANYRLYSPEDGKVFGKFSGKELLEKGITINIPTAYTAKVLGIEKVD